MPGTTYVETAIQIQFHLQKCATAQLESVQFQRPLLVHELDEPVFRSEYDPEQNQIRFYSRSAAQDQWTQHATVYLVNGPLTATSVPDLAALQQRCTQQLSADVLYARLKKRQLYYGPTFRCIQQLFKGDQELLVHIQAQAETQAYALHPTILDAAFHSLIGMVDDSDERSFVAGGLKHLSFYQTPGDNLWCYSRLTERSMQRIVADIWLMNAEGEVCVYIEEMQCVALDSAQRQRDIHHWFYQVAWQPQDLDLGQQLEPEAPWLIFSDQQGFAFQLAEIMACGFSPPVIQVSRGKTYQRLDDRHFTLRSGQEQDMKSLIQALNGQRIQGVVFAWSLDVNDQDADQGCGMALNLLYCVRAYLSLHENEQKRHTRFYILSQQAQALATTQPNQAQAIVIGLARVISSEYRIRCKLIDLDTLQYDRIQSQLLPELLSDDEEHEVALYAQQRQVYRLQPYQHLPQANINRIRGDQPFALQTRQEDCFWQQAEIKPLGAQQIDLGIQYLVLPAGFELGQHRSLFAFAQVLSSNNPLYNPGQNLIVQVPANRICSRLSVREQDILLLKLPKASWFRRSTSNRHYLPVELLYSYLLPDYAHAWYLFNQRFQLPKQAWVLIHASEDYRDLAAAQVALQHRCRVVMRYRQAEKAQQAQALGVQHCFASEDSEAMSRIASMNIQGFDAIISYSLDDAAQSLSLAATFAYIASPQSPKTEAMCNKQWVHLDLEVLAEQQTDIYHDILKNSLNSLAKSQWPDTIQLPVFSSNEVNEAVNACRKQRLILTLAASEEVQAVAPVAKPEQDFSGGSYLITGGFGGFGLKLAEWLAKHQAQYLVLVGRSGAVTDDARHTLSLLQADGVRIIEVKADISDEEQVKRLLQYWPEDFPPLTGVFHTAAVLDDVMLNELTAERLSRVMDAKAKGAWYLHKHSQHCTLDQFVLFSSISALVGKPGQGNYVAANTFLDQLAYYRKSQGLNALSLNWGVLAEVGMVSQQSQMEEHLQRMGIDSFTADEAMQMLSVALQSSATQLGLMNVDWEKFWNSNGAPSLALRYEHLLQQEWLDKENPLQQLYEQLRSLSANERFQLLTERLLTGIARIMRLPEDSIDPEVSLNDLGLDSLLATEIQSAVKQETGVNLTMIEIMQHNSLNQITEKVVLQLTHNL